LWHDPEAAEQRRERSRKGGVGRSNANRARKGIAGAVLTPADLQGAIARALEGVLNGKIEPGVGNAVASLCRASVAVREATELEQRLTELEQRAGVGDGGGRRRG